MIMEETYMFQELRECAHAAVRCLEENREALLALSSLVQKAQPSSIVLAARGTSLHAAAFAKYLFEEFVGLPTAIAEPSVVTKYAGKLDLSHSLVIGISQSGEGLDVCGIAARGRDCGGIAAAITNSASSRLASLSQICLDCCSGEEKSVSATKSFASQLSLVLAVAAHLSQNDSLFSLLAHAEDIFSDGLNLTGAAAALAERFSSMTDCVVLARGNSYPIAQEWALKCQETCAVRAHAFPASNFLHGPIAMVDPSVPALLLAFDRSTNDDMVQLIDRMEAVGAPILLVTNRQELAARQPSHILLPDRCEGLWGALAAVPVIQSFCCALSLSKGLNPDSPAGLNKVTVTK